MFPQWRAPCQAPLGDAGVPVADPVQKQADEELKAHGGRAGVDRPAAPERGLMEIARQGTQDHLLHRPAQLFDGALQPRAVARQVAHHHAEVGQRLPHRPGQEVFALIHPDSRRQPAERPIRRFT